MSCSGVPGHGAGRVSWVIELGVVAAHLHRHGDIRAVAVAPEPAVLAVELGKDLALRAVRAAALFIGHGLPGAVAVQVEVDPATFDDHPVFRGLSRGHDQLPLGGGARLKCEADLVAPDFSLLRMRRAHEGVQEAVEEARLVVVHGLHLAVCLGLGGELGLDLAHLGEAEEAADPRGVDAVFGGQHDRNWDRAGRGRGDACRAQELRGGGKLFERGFLGIEHVMSPFRRRSIR